MQATSCEERQTLKQRPRVSNAHGRERHLGCPDMIASVANNDGVNRRASMLGAPWFDKMPIEPTLSGAKVGPQGRKSAP